MFTLEDYTIIAHLLPRFLGLVYFCAFWPFILQIRGLIGENGILPLTRYLDFIRRRMGKRGYYILPTLFWLNSSNRALIGVAWLGTILSILLMCGVYPSLVLFLLFFLYLSIISAGQDFLGFGWEVFLQEAALNTWLLSLTTVPNVMVWISLNLLLFRFHFQGGAVKIQSHDPNWRNLTAISYHYESQPIPNFVAWYIHKLPMWFHKLSCALMFVSELVVPFFIFFSELFRLVAFVSFIGLQLFIWATGNFSYLNYLTVVLTLILLNNATLSYFGFATPQISPTPMALDIFLTIAGGILLLLQLMRLWDHFYPNMALRNILNAVSPLHVANRYGIFAIMTTTRYEMVIQGSDDGKTWKEYNYKHKPSELWRRPTRIAPYQPRLDWQAWFLPFQPFQQEYWYQSFILQLLRGNKEVLALLKNNPFPDKPPKYIQTWVYIYSFTTIKEKKETKNWWKRKLIGLYGPTCSLPP